MQAFGLPDRNRLLVSPGFERTVRLWDGRVQMSAMFRIPIRPDFELRLCVHSHAAAAFALVEQNREHLGRWLPWVDHTWSQDDVMHWISNGLEKLQRNEGWQAALWYQDRLAGFIGFKPVDWANMRVEIG